jgi:hypothetical protein
MALGEHRLLSHVLTAINEYRVGSRSAENLQRELSGVMSAVESDVPKSVRDALVQAEARIDSARFTVDLEHQSTAIGKILDDLESAIRAGETAR